ncbi:MAG TPA: ATP-binding protein [Woeseiaceae bacterium]|nr:ATP-binding protein [Woeseiaceae bacterium]
MTGLASSGRHDLFSETAEEMYNNAPCGFLSADAEGTIIRANRRVAEMSGRSLDELVGQVRFQELLTVGGRIYYETHVGPLLLMQDHVEEIALDIRGPDGIVPVLLNAEVRRHSNGEVIGIRASILDATERRRYERELLASRNAGEEAARMKGELISMISHDIRTPLSTLTTIGELLEMSPLNEDQAKYVRMLKSSTSNLLRLVNDVLDLGKIEAGHMRLINKPVNLRQLVRGLGDETRIEAHRKGLRFDVDIDPRLPPRLLTDAIKLGRVLSNLLGNAVKFTDSGEVGLVVQLLDIDNHCARVGFEVRDTGIGIPKDQIDRIFDDFRQGNDEIGSRYGGSGLGLGICKKFLALLGAELAVDSAPGTGTSFHFELDMEQAAPGLDADS